MRWDQAFLKRAPGDGTIDDVIVAAVKAAVVTPEREVPKWFAWRWRFDTDLLDRLVSEGRLARPEPGWLAAPASA